jgi:serine/threonine protein kinase
MKDSELDQCFVCGAPIAASDTRCPNGHECDLLDEADFLYSNESLLGTVDLAEGSWSSRPSPLFECERCARLVEMHEHLGRSIFPNFCPWCGKPVRPIIGREIDGYRIDDLIAEGGFGLVYLASNVAEPKMKAVVKFLRPRLGYLRPELRRIFVEEARLAEEIGQRCWNIGRVWNVREKPYPYFFMEYIRGVTLDELLRESRDERIPLEDCKGFLRGIAKALAATHARNRIHRDLKPLNIMVIKSGEVATPEERIKLIDFGLALKIAGGRSTFVRPAPAEAAGHGPRAQSSPIQNAGTPEYMAPEGFDGLNEFAGDLYSFGVTAYEILAGESPWMQPPAGTQRFFYWRNAHKSTPPRPLRELRPDAPQWLSRVVLQCLEKEPAKRIRSAEELISRLREPLSAWVKGAVAAAVLLVACLGWLALTRSVEPREEVWSRQVWVAAAQELAERKDLVEDLVVDARDGKISACTQCPKPLECTVEDGKLRLRFRKGAYLESLIDKTLCFEATGEGFRLKGELKIGLDAVPPTFVGEVRWFDRRAPEGGLWKVENDMRFHPDKAAFAVAVEEERLESVHLKSSRHGKRPVEIPGSETPIGSETLWTFDLPQHPEGYKCQIKAVDKAGNSVETDPFEFTVDSGVEISISRSFVTRGRAFFELNAQEPLSDLQVEGTRRWELYRPPQSLQGVLDLTRGLDGLRKLPWKPPLAEDKYLLAVLVEDDAQGPFLLKATDTARPANETDRPLEFKSPERLSVERIGEYVETIRLHFTQDELILMPPDLKPPRPVRCPDLKKVTVETKVKHCIHGARLQVNLEKVEAQTDVSEASLSLTPPGDHKLRENAQNELILELLDPLERPLRLERHVTTDLKKPVPRLTSHSPKMGLKGDHRVRKWSEIELCVEDDEPLSSAEWKIGLRSFPGSAAVGSEDRRFCCRLPDDLPFAEGNQDYAVEVMDLAKNMTTESGTLALNPEGPRIVPVSANKLGGTLEIVGEVASFTVEDANGFVEKGSRAEVRLPDGRLLEPRIDVPQGGEAGRVRNLDLGILPAECSGTLKVVFQDSFGYEGSWEGPFTFRRPQPQYAEIFICPSGIAWVLIKPSVDQSKWFYITRCEVSNELYRRACLEDRVPPPLYWGPNYSFPQYSRGDGPAGDAARYPAVGMAPKDAERVAGYYHGARLPTYEEWRQAAWRTKAGGQYPWATDRRALPYANCYAVSKLDDSPFPKDLSKTTIQGGIRHWIVEVDFDPFESCPPKLREDLQYRLSPESPDILHLIGNVSELVKLQDGSYGVAGGSFNDNYEAIDLRKDPLTFRGPDSRTGFRMVRPIEGAPHEFIEAAKKKEGAR